jgi:hypothetical protein
MLSVKNRNPIFVVLASVFTFFLYALYWFYVTREELNEATGGKTSALLWMIGFFVPLVNIYVIWKYCEDVEKASKGAQSTVLLFILAQYLTQVELNKLAK